MKRFSVLLLMPDALSENYGQETHLAHVVAEGPLQAMEEARNWAARETLTTDPDDWFVLACFEGHLQDLSY